MFLCQEDFVMVVCFILFVFFDFIVENSCGEFLFGKRINCSVQGYWFVLGGCVQKDEMLEVVFEWLMMVELGLCLLIIVGQFYGVWQYFYDDNFFGMDFIIYYVVFGFCFRVLEEELLLLDEQYDDYCWLMLDVLFVSDNVYVNSCVYFFVEKCIGVFGL